MGGMVLGAGALARRVYVDMSTAALAVREAIFTVSVVLFFTIIVIGSGILAVRNGRCCWQVVCHVAMGAACSTIAAECEEGRGHGWAAADVPAPLDTPLGPCVGLG